MYKFKNQFGREATVTEDALKIMLRQWGKKVILEDFKKLPVNLRKLELGGGELTWIDE